MTKIVDLKKVCLAILVLYFLTLTSSAEASDYKLNLIKRFYSIGTASINGTYYPVGNSIARTLTRKLKNLVVIAEPTAGSVANIEYLKNGQVDLALIQSDVAWQAANGTGMFIGNRYRELRILASLYSEFVQIVVRKGSGIKTINDLKGARISVGSKESGSAVNVIQVLAAAGLNEGDYTLVYERFTRATESLNDGYVDAVYYTGGIPADGISRLAAKTELSLVEIPEEVKEKLVQNFPFFTSETIPARTYNGQTEKVSTIGLRALMATSEQVGNDEVEAMLNVLYENASQITSQNLAGNLFSRVDALKGVEKEMLHPGAKKFFSVGQVSAEVPGNEPK